MEWQHLIWKTAILPLFKGYKFTNKGKEWIQQKKRYNRQKIYTDIFPKKKKKGTELMNRYIEKVLHITSHHVNVNQNHNEISPHNC